MLLNHAEARCLRFREGDEKDVFASEHDNYQRLADAVTHRREIHRCGDVIEVTDILKCGGDHAVGRLWNFPELCDVEITTR